MLYWTQDQYPVSQELLRNSSGIAGDYTIRASQGFDRGPAAGEAIRRLMREIANLNTNAEDNLAYAA